MKLKLLRPKDGPNGSQYRRWALRAAFAKPSAIVFFDLERCVKEIEAKSEEITRMSWTTPMIFLD